MNLLKELDDIGFDLERAKSCAETYKKAVGCECSIIDSHGKQLYNTGNDKGACSFCKKLQGILQIHQNCTNAHLYGSYQAERFGGNYVFFCPTGLVHWASPISNKGMMKGALLGGPVLMMDPEEFLMDDVVIKYNIGEDHIEELRRYIVDIPTISPDVVNSLSEMLFIVASHISGKQYDSFSEERDLLEQQSDISEYIHYIKTMGGSPEASDAYPLEKERELLKLISLGDKAGSQKILNEIFGHIFFSTGGKFDIIKARVLELVVLLSRAALEGGADVETIFGLNYKFLGEVHDFQTVEELTYWLSKIMTRFTDCVFNLAGVKHVDVIYKASDYIKKNYMKKLTLEEVSSHVYLSPSYFSKVFKDEMKFNFNAYLNHIRIEMGKKLLSDEKVALVDISSMVGFEDQSYFTKVFKKITGISPGRYRESRGTVKQVGL
jgi:two-component system, response regulator YesN